MGEQSCGTCKHWIYYHDVINHWSKVTHRMGGCGAPEPDSSDHNPRSDMASTEGKTCPCYQPNQEIA